MEKTIRKATLSIPAELRKLEVGEEVAFPITDYNYNTIRQAPSNSLLKEKMDGWDWKTRKDFETKCIIVTRIS